MKNIFIFVAAFTLIILPTAFCNAEIIFQSKWDNPNSDPSDLEDDAGAWHYAYVASGNISLERVSGDQSDLGGPTSTPPNSDATYILRETWVPNGSDCQVYLQANFAPQHKNLTDYYGGMWVYFQNGIQFIDSVKFFDFRTSNPSVGNGHLALFGFDHNAMGCGTAVHSSWNAISNLCSYPDGHTISVWRYLAGPGQNVSGNSYMFNYYDSPIFETNIDSSGSALSEVGYSADSPDRVCIEGGYWMAFIFHARIHETDGRYECWIKKGEGPLKKVMDWNRDTVWSQSDGPHNFYTKNGTGVDHLQVNAYWNSWTGASGTRRMWISNVVVATTYEDVDNYLGIPPNPPENLSITAP